MRYHFNFDSFNQLRWAERFHETPFGIGVIVLSVLLTLVSCITFWLAGGEAQAKAQAAQMSHPGVIADVKWNWVGDVQLVLTDGREILLPGHTPMAGSIRDDIWGLSSSRIGLVEKYVGSVVFPQYTPVAQKTESWGDMRTHSDEVGTWLQFNLATCEVHAN